MMRLLPRALGAPLLLAALVACSPSASGGVTYEDAWIKATDTEMTSMFGVVHNGGSTAITLVEARAEEAAVVELHTVVDDGKGNMVMTAVEEGFTIAPGEDFVLEPGAEHIMLMGLREEIEVGAYIGVELVFDDGQVLEAQVPAKEFAGAEETYHHDE